MIMIIVKETVDFYIVFHHHRKWAVDRWRVLPCPVIVMSPFNLKDGHNWTQ